MKVLVLNTQVPFTHGGAEELADNLVRQLSALPGVEAELVQIPFRWDPPLRLIDEMLIFEGVRLPDADRVIALKFPAYLIPHPRKTLWVLHQFRQAYDLAGQWHDTAEAHVVRDAIRATDNACLAGCERLFVNSRVTRDRMVRFNGIEPQVLHPPLNDPQLFTGGEHGDYVFAGGRVCEAKRQHLLIEAAAQARGGAKLVIAGPPESAAYAEHLRTLVARHGLEDRVRLDLRLHSRAEIAALANGALACAYIPFDEDSYGYVTMEAFAAGKAVLTTDDSGGLLDLVDAESGLVVAPTAEALGAGLAEFAAKREATIAMGQNGRRILAERGLSWDRTLERLIGA